ncbi:protein ECM7 [Achaetomium macrosporum]|uniref:Protein ECM7 n=1 Tax=Achaetomium macrosporum TaxID=79813 RepID=A0AAN7CFM6_9PEZI|nr:protein ECM7 [Achaetomium macrosporum]
MTRDLPLVYRLSPLLCSLVAFILVMLAIFAGYSPGILEGYDILLVDTSRLRKQAVDRAVDLTSTPPRTTETNCDGVGSLLGPLCESMTSALPIASSAVASPADRSEDKAKDTRQGIADSAMGNAHIRGFYTLHLLTVCEGDFAEDGSRQVSMCHRFFSNEPSKISALLDTNLPDEPLDSHSNITLTDLGISNRLASALDNLNTFIKAAAVLYSIGVTLTCLSFLLSIPYVFRNAVAHRRYFPPLIWANFSVTIGALFFLLLGGVVASIGAVAWRDRVNDLGEDNGVSAANGRSWVILAWVAFTLMLVVLVSWAWEVRRVLRKRRLVREQSGENGQGMPMGARRPPYPPGPLPPAALL